jgi:hypothetical protein
MADHALVHLAKRTLLADQDAVLRDDPGYIAFKGGNADQEQSERHDPECRNEWSAARGPGEQARDNNQQNYSAGARLDKPFPERGSLRSRTSSGFAAASIVSGKHHDRLDAVK